MNRIFCTFVLFFALSVTVYATDATLNTRNLRVADIAKAEAKAKAIAIFFSLSIIAIYTAQGLNISMLLEPDFINRLSTK